MIKKNLFLITLISILIFSGCSYIQKENKDYLIATCPTTYEYLKKINIPEENIIQKESTAEALQLLNNNNVQIAFVGRNAYPNEIKNDILKIELFNRNTIISKENFHLNIIQLQQLTILTYLSEQEHNNLNLKFINEEEIYENQNNLFLVSWDDFDKYIQQGFKLVNVYDGINKVDSFRNPQLYFKEEYEDIAKQIAQKIKE